MNRAARMNRRRFLNCVFASAALPFVPAPVEIMLNAVTTSPLDRNFYVNALFGSDTGTGTPSAPWRTIQAAMDYINQLDVDDGNITVHVAPGNYDGFIGP
jgi:hypothetical protein